MHNSRPVLQPKNESREANIKGNRDICRGARNGLNVLSHLSTQPSAQNNLFLSKKLSSVLIKQNILINYNAVWLQLLVRVCKTWITSRRNQIYQIWKEKRCCNISRTEGVYYVYSRSPGIGNQTWRLCFLFLSLLPEGSSFFKISSLSWYSSKYL